MEGLKVLTSYSETTNSTENNDRGKIKSWALGLAIPL